MHDMLNLSGQTDRDSESGCSGSYTDSGRGPSEEGDNNYLFNNSHQHLSSHQHAGDHPFYPPPPAESRSKYPGGRQCLFDYVLLYIIIYT